MLVTGSFFVIPAYVGTQYIPCGWILFQKVKNKFDKSERESYTSESYFCNFRNMPTNTSTTWSLDPKDSLINPMSVSLNDVASVLGKWQMVMHFQSRSSKNKNFPTSFEYKGISLPEVLEELGKYRVSPTVARSREHAGKIMREGSMFVSDTYVFELPWDVFVVYQLGNIRDFTQAFQRLQDSDRRVGFILDLTWENSPYDPSWLRKPEWVGFGDDGRPLPKLETIELIPRRENDNRYDDTQRMWWKPELKTIPKRDFSNLKK